MGPGPLPTMNTAPLFDSNGSAKVQLGAVSLNKIVIGGQRTQLLPSHGARVSTTPGGTAISIPKRRTATPVLPPFHLTLTPKGDDTFQVEVNRGHVVARIPTADDALAYYMPDNLMDGDSPKKFDISSGQAIYCTVKILATGDVDTVTLDVGGDNQESTHYSPEVAETSGEAGTLKYKLGVLNSGTRKMDEVCAGSNIHIDRDIPSFMKKGGTYDIFADYSLLNGRYRTKGLSEDDAYSSGLSPIGIVDHGDFLEFYARGSTFTLEIWETSISVDGTTLMIPNAGSYDEGTGAVTLTGPFVSVVTNVYKTNSSDAVKKIYFFDGIAYRTLPDGMTAPTTIVKFYSVT